MAKTDQDEIWVQLATRIPKGLHRQLRIECVAKETTVQDFVVAALREKFGRDAGRRQRRA
jgi:hypothetical protein